MSKDIRRPRPWEPWQSWHKLRCGFVYRHPRKSEWYRLCAGSKKWIRWCRRCGELEVEERDE